MNTRSCFPACSPTEIIAFSDRAKEFEKLGCQLIGELRLFCEQCWWLSAISGATTCTSVQARQRSKCMMGAEHAQHTSPVAAYHAVACHAVEPPQTLTGGEGQHHARRAAQQQVTLLTCLSL